MKPIHRLLAPFIVVAGLLASCSDDLPQQQPSEGEAIDNYVGPTGHFTFGPEVKGFTYRDFTLKLKAPDGSIISRKGNHSRNGEISSFQLDTGLADGEYEMLYLEYATAENPELASFAEEFPVSQYGLGARVCVSDGTITVLDSYDEGIDLFGEGTAENPYRIESYHHLMKLAQYVNSEETNGLITKDTYFEQTVDIDMYQASLQADKRYGWLPIGASTTRPFRGHYKGCGMTHLLIDRPHTAGVGLFGFVHNAAISGIRMKDSEISGNFAVGAIVGASIMSGQDRGFLSLTGCHINATSITGSDESACVGALAGAVDMNSRALLQDCISDGNEVSATYNAGGLLGGCGFYSYLSVNNCTNSSTVRTDYSGAGGIIGSCDTVYVAASHNIGAITGAAASRDREKSIGAGGLLGGANIATITSSDNSGKVSGYAGVGGLLGSTRVKGSATEAYMYGNVMLRYSFNTGDVSGTDCVGGIVGESQTGCYAVYNTGDVTGSRYVAGVAGCTSIAVVHNAINSGHISGGDYVSGIIGKTTFGSIALNHNYGEATATGSHLGGIIGLAGNNTIMHYCGNYGLLESKGNGPVGGLVGEVGDPREWTGMNIAECVVGVLEIGMSVLGPLIAVGEHAVEGIAHGFAIFLKVSEIVADASLLVTDTGLLGVGVYEMIEESEVSAMSEELSIKCLDINNKVKSDMSGIRHSFSPDCGVFDASSLRQGYVNSVESTLGYYETEGNDELFNAMINLTREEREEELEKRHKTDEIIHEVTAGVCILVGTVAAIGGAVATGGAAVPFILAGSMASIAGGLNAITKSVLEFEENVVVISQCVNAGDIKAKSGNVGGLVGDLQDASIIRDCLNTGDGPGFGNPFAQHCGTNASIRNVISLSGDYSSWSASYPGAVVSAVIYKPGADGSLGYNSPVLYLDVKDISDAGKYTSLDSNWKVGAEETSRWKFGSTADNTFPVPDYSEMRK